MALFQYIWVNCCGYTSRDRNHWNHPGRSSNVGGVSILRDIALNALGVRPEELCQDKARNLLYNLSDSLRG
jgi:hypothetical protein